MYPFTALIALAVDASVGYPQWIYERIGHPVSWIGRLITWCELRWNGPAFSFTRRRFNGAVALIVVLAVTTTICVALTQAIGWLIPQPYAVLLLALTASTLIAQRSLDEHVMAVASALEQGGVEAGRHAVGMIVGRDTAALDEAGVSRAAIESLAENYSDGIVAPLFWMLFGGLTGAGLYKAINTADSMIGHKSERYRAFGWASARFDDLVNLPASRLAALFLIVGAGLAPGCNPRAALHAVINDARRHRSPNAGWPEAAMAGALGIALAGPRTYHGAVVNDGWMGSGRHDIGAPDIRRALRLYRIANVAQATALALIALATLLLVR
ncbi:MAG: adenosylcobinamide-phosphate synthase CbiB [Hyphomicrobium sp.]|jgi:adenosylcobinamide-phosphate synthase